MVHYSIVPRFRVSFSRYGFHDLQLGSLLPHHGFRFFFNSFTSHTSSDGNHVKGDTFTKSYLINSCGLSPDLATKLSNGVLLLKNPDGPNAVLDLLMNYGFSKTQLAKLVEKKPVVLATDAKKTLLPKFEFFRSIGVSDGDLPKIIIRNHSILSSSLNKCLIPRYEILRGVVGDDQEVVRALRVAPRDFTNCGIMNDLVLNIEVLKQCGVPQSSISLLITNYPSAAYVKHSRFVEVVKGVKEIGFESRKTLFVMAIKVLATLSKATWELRIEFYKRWGWNREITLQAFRIYPNFMKLSEEMITRKMSFLVKDMGLSSVDIAQYPQILGYNLEKRIIPRFSVIKILKPKGLVNNNLHFSYFTRLSEEIFLMKFVIKFQADLPRLPDVYKGAMDYHNVI